MQMRWLPLMVIASVVVGLSPSGLLRGQNSSVDLEQHKERAEQALRANDRATAEKEFRSMLSIDPQDSEAWTGLGVLLYGSGNADEASKALHSALAIDPGGKRAELFLGLSEADLHDCSQAMPILLKYFSSEPVGNLQRLTGLAVLGCSSEANDTMAVLQTAVRLRQLYPGDADVLYASAELYTQLWNQSAGELLAMHPDSYRVHQLAAEVYEAQKNYDQAIREYSLALAANPKLPQMHYRIGQLYLHQGAPDADEKAMEEFRLEKLVNPESAVSDLAMAEIYRHQHNLDMAKPLYDEAARLDPQLVEAKVGLAQILLDEHQTDVAVRELTAVIAQHPDNAQAHYALMLAYRTEGKLPEAAEQMAAFKQLQAGNDQKFQNKLDALLNAKPKDSGETAPK
jgi:tetratricopeptide (TPR) repeat protein